MKKLTALLLCLLMLTGMAGCTQQASAPAETASPEVQTAAPSPAVADASQMTAVEDVEEEGMVPVYVSDLLEGDYPVQVESSSSMFRVESAVLHVRNGSMEVTLTMGGTSYLYVYPGSAMDAATGEESGYIPFAEDAEGNHSFTLPVEALDEGFPCAAFSKNKELWYDRTLLLRADSLPVSAFREGFFVTAESLGLADGAYTVSVTLTGGSGKAKIQSPARLMVQDGAAEVEIVWSSSNYDYMKVDEEKIFPQEGRDTSTFLIPVPFFDRPVSVIADTVAMSEPHEITYTLLFSSESLGAVP